MLIRAGQVMAIGFLLIGWVSPVAAGSDDNPLDSFEIHPDFTLELVAREPMVLDPVDLAFDAAGRAFVVEMPGYPLREAPGRVVLLEDTDDDNVYDHRTVFADGLPVADSLLPYRGGLLVASPPDLVFLADRDGDRVADEQRVILTGFPDGNTQHNFNGLTYGLDNWIYAANGGNSGTPYWPGRPGERMSIRWSDFRFDPAGQRFETIGPSSGGFELAFNAYGHLFETHNLRHIQHLAFFGKYVRGIPDSRPLTPIASYAENGLSRIYAIGEQVERPNHPEQAGYFSAACGVTCYTGGAFPAAFEGNVFVGDAVLNLVHRMTIHPDGTGLEARRGRERVEFLASRDRWFRPVNMTVGPDGALYVLDMHREHIEHPEWIPDEMEAEMDLRAGIDKGRIYRVVPQGGLPSVTPAFPRNDLDAVVGHLDHPNKWWRDTAQRLLVWWADAEATPPLEALWNSGETSPLGRIHALWTLDGLGALTEAHLVQGISDPDPAVREQTLVVLETHLDDHPALLDRVIALCGDEAARVRRQALLCLSTREDVPAVALERAVGPVMDRDLDDAWIPLALLAASRPHLNDVLGLALARAQDRRDDGMKAFVKQLTGLAATENYPATLTAVLGALGRAAYEDGMTSAILEGIATQGGSAVPDPLSETEMTTLERLMAHDNPQVAGPAWTLAERVGHERPELVGRMLETSREVVLDSSAAPETRLSHLELLSHAPFAERFGLLQEVILSPAPAMLQEAAMEQLRDEASRAVAEWLIAHWRQLAPGLIRPATDILLYRRENQPLMLAALENGTLGIGQFNFDLERRRHLLRSGDPEIRERAERLFSDAGVVTRREAIQAMAPALTLDGDPERGRAVYLQLCAQCHQVGAVGHDVGPNLTEIFRKSKKTLLQDILDPNAAVDPGYISYTVTLKADSDSLLEQAPVSGILVAETADSVTIRAAGGVETTYDRSAIAELASTGLSTMPEGLELGMSHQQMADLLAFLQQPR